MYRCILLLSLLAGLGSMPEVAKAQTSNIERLYEQGKNLLEQSDYDGALRSFKTALQGADGRAGITWQMVLAIAVTYRELDKPAFAIEYFRRFLSLTDAHKDITTQKWRDRRERVAQDLSELERALEKTHGFFNVLSTPTGAKVFLDGVPAGADQDAQTPFGLILKPGRHTIAVQANGFVSDERTVEVSAGQFDSLQFDLKQASQDTAPPNKAVSAGQTPTEGLALEATLEAPEAMTPVGAYVLFGTAGASAIAAAIVSVLASEEHKNLETLSIEGDPNAGDIAIALKGQWRDAESAMNTYQTLSYALYGAAAATAIGGLIWMLVDDPSTSAQDASMTPHLKLNPTQRGLNANLEWSF